MNDIITIGVLLCAVLASGVGLIYTKHESRALLVELQELQVRRDDLEIEWGLLQLEQSMLSTEVAVDQAARARLRMALPDLDSTVYIMR